MALVEKPSPAFKAHMAAVQSGTVTKTNIIGIRKLLNGSIRRAQGWSVGMSTPKGDALDGGTYEAFRFINIPWQSGGDGPEIVHG